MTRTRMLLLVVVGLLVGVASPAFAAEAPQRQDLIREIVAAWQARQEEVKTLTCSAKVESFYPAGYLTDKQFNDFQKRGKAKNPPEDKRFPGHVSWAIDFAARRVKKESDITKPHFYAGGSDCELAPDPGIELFTNGQCKFFRPSGYQPTAKTQEAAAQVPDAVLYGERTPGVLDVNDLPLLWLAGGVNGQYPGPKVMQQLDGPERFTYRGEAQWKDHQCIVLTVQEQKDSTAVREFWVGLEKPYPIYYCRARDGKLVWWQLEVDYHTQDGRLVPASWTVTGYNVPFGKLFDKSTFTVEQIDVNTPLPPGLFERSLEPGMVVDDAVQNKLLQVSPNGRLVPLGNALETGVVTRILFWATLVLFAVAVVVFVWRWVRKRRAFSQ